MKKLKSLLIIIAFSFTTLPTIGQITEIGLASFYADKFDGRVTASGDIFDQNKMTGAHRTLPFGSQVKVTNMKNSKTVVVTINDRGPFVKDRVIDLSKAGARKLDFIDSGVTQVKVEVIRLGESESASKSASQANEIKTDEKKPINNASTAITNTPAVAPSISESAIEYYKLDSESITPQGFGIQVASYQEAANLMKRCAEIKNQINKDVIVQVGNSNGNKVYRIMIGIFPNRESAENYNKNLNNLFNGSFVAAF